MKRVTKIISITLLLLGLTVPAIGCSESSEAEGMENQAVAVQQGNLTIDVTAAGNLALSHTADLAFEIAGTVEEVLVEEGDTVEEGQVLAKLDTTEYQDYLTSLERQLATKKLDLIQAEINFIDAEMALEDALDYYVRPIEISAARRTVRNAEISLLDAKDELSLATSKDDKEDLAHDVKRAEEQLREAEMMLTELYEKSDPDTPEVTVKRMQLEQAQGRLDDAREELDDAQEELDDALGESPVVIAPFAGFITRVNVAGGDEVMQGTVAVQLADPNKFEADILVSEMDILQVKLGGRAQVQVDAMPEMSLPAEVTHISPIATIQQGVVNYTLTVELQSPEAVGQGAMQRIQQGELPERLRQAIEEGRITQEQAEEMVKQRQEEQGGQQGQVPAAIPENFQLREGLTVTVGIIVDERNDVLLVANGAITTQGRQTYVQVLSPDGTIEQRAITTGISNWQYTEVIDGLSEGEKVVVPQGTRTTSATQQQRSPGGIVPGVGRMLR